MENSTVKQDKLSEVLNKSNVMVLVMFLAIYFVIYFLMDVFNKEQSTGEQKDVRMSKLLDIMVFSFVLIYLVSNFFNMNETEKSNIVSNNLDGFLEFSNDPYSIFYVLIFILTLYLGIYVLKIPMEPGVKPVSINIIDNFAIIVFVILLVSDFFKLVFQINIIEIFITFLKNGWDRLDTRETDDEDDETDISGNKDVSGNDEVFNVANNIYTYDDAQTVCSIYGAKLATYDQIEKSYQNGGEWCNYGWSDGQMAFFPTQKSSYERLQKSDKTKNKCGRPGVNGGYMANPKLKFGVNCYGKKPDPSDAEKNHMYVKGAFQDIIEEESEEDRKTRFLKDNADKLLVVNSFNRNKWSKY
jgi:hypothetical protein|tara:strand:+ start:3301 stop:4368 length:1068 start_codon:yes stop_codon:yes gene_type:complete